MKITHVGGPTALLTLGGLSFLTDPAFDQPRDYQLPGRVMTKLTGPAVSIEDLGPIDAVLLSHDQHKDNLDDSGRELLPTVPLVLSTPDAAERIAGVHGLENWESVALPRPDGGTVTVTGLPARHGPEGCESVTGIVTGFLLSGEDLPTVYVSGDNASVELVEELVARLKAGTIPGVTARKVDVALLFAGAARTPLLDGAPLTLTSEAAVEAARLLSPAVIVPVHTEGWAHFSEGPDHLAKTFTAAGLTGQLHVPVAGAALSI
ncbi:MBL fold metallo-hydrolase [Kribbella qitaiheensis]|uniref:MBL fold metallo-hydrolase n=1 Tax=Kribbella qitaiheensis TaxID=1544730 RepID=A0A7G6X3F8_9ACTN|nr:MBL fold metallo-hydrolase [Kribbella qitaiheensis]QNE20773.1 MBL fold metallo-hydrolase [Kribbella qitaiheensis]